MICRSGVNAKDHLDGWSCATLAQDFFAVFRLPLRILATRPLALEQASNELFALLGGHLHRSGDDRVATLLRHRAEAVVHLALDVLGKL